LPVSDTPEDVLRSVFGFPAFRPGQQEIVERLLNGTHTLCVMPTGFGKSLCYQIPALIGERLTVVVSPLVALMDDQVAGLRVNGIDAACIHSGRPRADNVEDWLRVRDGAAPLLYLSPERLMTERMLAQLEKLDPAMFVVDEAHCISKWGTSFRPEYEALSALVDRFPNATLAAFTATADMGTRRDIAAKLFRGKGDIVVHGFDRPNLRLGVEAKTNWPRQIVDFLEPRRDRAGIVYCLSRRLTEEVAAFLVERDYRALPYHAGLSAETRKENQEIFMAEDGVVMVATIAFGMGIDKPDVRFVYHLNLPGSMEAYYQEIGRAGRDGAPAEVQLLYGLGDIRMRRQFIDSDGGSDDHRNREHKRLDSLLAYCEATRCRRVSLLAYFGDESEPCGNCDICLDPPTVVDGTEEARKLFAAIADTGERFGTGHVVDVVRGTASEKILDRGHDRLAGFGAGKDRPKTWWQAFIRQAVAGGYLWIDIERFGSLRLTEKGQAVRQGTERFYSREIGEARASRRSRRSDPVADGEVRDFDAGLFAHLKRLRRELADARNVPAYVIFSDATLQDMCRARPATVDDLATVSGVGPKKLKNFGEAFLDAIGEYVRQAPA
jgi:ATP-dependent DNA helicase RecQ